MLSDDCFQHHTHTTAFGSSKDTGVRHMFPLLLKTHGGEPQFGTQMPGYGNPALSCFVLN